MYICLIRPPTITTVGAVGEDTAPPIGVAYLASAVREAGHSVSVIDALGDGIEIYERISSLDTGMRHGMANADIIARIPKGSDVIAVTTMFSLEWPFTRDLINDIGAEFPNAKLIAGGEHITALPDYALEDCHALDICCLGEGELTIVALLDALSNKTPLDEVPGLYFRKDGGITQTLPQSRNRDFNSLAWPAWDLIPIETYLSSGAMTGVNFGRSMPIIASRGCPYECTFCSNPVMWGRLWRIRPVEAVIEEMEHYIKLYNVTNFDFYDLTAIVKRKWIIEFCNALIEKGLNITWQLPSGTRSEALDKTVTDLLNQSGCRYINYAPESGSEATLKRIKKKVDKENMAFSMRAGVSSDLNIKANIVLGFPGERPKERYETLYYIVRMSMIGINDVSVFPFSPYPGSELFESSRKSGGIQLCDDYFISLSQYTDPTYTQSYCETLTARQLRIWCLFSMAVFYGTSFLRYPTRFFRLMYSVWKMMPNTKLGDALVRIRKKSAAIKKSPNLARPRTDQA